jgi:hypothetical protein
MMGPNNQQQQQPNDASGAPSSQQLPNVPLGSQLLTQNEQQLCSAMNLTPSKYLTLKTVLLNGNVQIKCTNLSENAIKKFLTKAGWVQTTTTTTQNAH